MENNNPTVVEFAPNVWLLKDSGTVLSFGATITAPDAGGNCGREISITVGEKAYKIWTWGADNNLPQLREDLVRENNIVGELISTKQTVTLGGGLYFYRREYRDGEETEVKVPKPSWFTDLETRMDVPKYLRSAAKNLFFHANTFTRVLRDRSQQSFVHSIQSLEARHVRAERQNVFGAVERWFWCGNWKKTSKRDQFPIRIFEGYKADVKAQQREYIIQSGTELLTDDYYYEPAWWGGRKWIELANRIPIFHLSNLKHGYLIRYHIEIPKDYFHDRSAAAQTLNDPKAMQTARDKESQARNEFIKKVNELLAGEANAGRALFTEFEINRQIQKEYPGIKIHTIEADIKDEALLKLFAASNDANISGQGVHPALASIQTGGKLSSGSEIQNAHTMYEAIKTQEPRRLLVEPLEHVRNINAEASERDIEIGFRTIKIAQLNEDKSGRQEVGQPT